MEILIRPARKEELGELARLYMAAYQGLERYGEPSLVEAISYLDWLYSTCPEGFFVAEVSGRPVGFIAVNPDWRDRERGKVLEIHEVVVDPAWRGKGVGRRLMEHALDLGRSLGREVASLWVGEGNVRAIAWYRSLGFREEGRWGEWIRMRRPLSGPTSG